LIGSVYTQHMTFKNMIKLKCLLCDSITYKIETLRERMLDFTTCNVKLV